MGRVCSRCPGSPRFSIRPGPEDPGTPVVAVPSSPSLETAGGSWPCLGLCAQPGVLSPGVPLRLQPAPLGADLAARVPQGRCFPPKLAPGAEAAAPTGPEGQVKGARWCWWCRSSLKFPQNPSPSYLRPRLPPGEAGPSSGRLHARPSSPKSSPGGRAEPPTPSCFQRLLN